MSEPSANPYSPPRAPLELPPEPVPASTLPREGPEGLGGWLVIVGIGLILSPFRILIFSAQTYPPLIRDGTLAALANPASTSFHPALAAIIVVEAVVNLFFLGFSVWLIALFFQKSRRFPMRYVGLAAFSVAFILADSAVLSLLNIGSSWDAESMQELLRSVIGLVIWGPYMLMSKRVRNTFVER